MKISRVYTKDGRYYYVEDLLDRHPRTGRPKQKWHKLTRVDQGEPALLESLKAFLGDAPTRTGNMPRLLREFMTTHGAGLTFGVRKEYERMVDVIADEFEHFNVTDVRPSDVLTFLKSNFSDKPTTLRHYKARLSTFFSWCVLAEHLEINPCREIKVARPPRRKGRMNAERFWAIHAALTPMGQCFAELTFLTFQRPTEIRLLRESQIGDTHIRFTPTKTEHSTGDEVEILITPEIRAALDRARALRPKQKITVLAKRRDPYLIQARDGDRYSKNGLYEVWRDAVTAANCAGVTTRDIRPFALATLEAAGCDLREIQKVAVHSTSATTEGYLDQHRDRLSSVAIPLPQKQKT